MPSEIFLTHDCVFSMIAESCFVMSKAHNSNTTVLLGLQNSFVLKKLKKNDSTNFHHVSEIYIDHMH